MEATATGRIAPVDRFFEFSLLGLLASGYLAVAGSGYLDLPTLVVTAVALLARMLIAAGVVQLQLPAGIISAVTLAYVAFYPLDYLFISGTFIPATVHLVFFVAVVKILTASSDRDYFFLKLIAFMELLAACVLSSNFNFFGFLLLFLVLGVATFASGEIRRSRARRQTVARVSARGLWLRLSAVVLIASTGILMLTAGLFFFLPRTARAAFQHFMSHRYHLAGFSNHVTLGEIGEIKRENTPVMHVKMDHPEDRPLSLKWRGAALSEFNGRTWSAPPFTDPTILRPGPGGLLVLANDAQLRSESKHISYSVHLNELATDALFFAGSPQYLRIDSPVRRTWSDNYHVSMGDPQGVWYQVYSRLDPPARPEDQTQEWAEPLLPLERRHYLELPRSLDPRIDDLARKIVGTEKNPAVEARLIENYLRRNYGYTLELPPSEPADPLSFFLFHRKKGHCEYFASSMAVMLRIVGIPSRMATGFQSGVFNPISGSQLIRTSDAHAWVEAWLPHYGWATFDPTPPDPNPPRLSVWTRLGFYTDAAEVFWQDWVLNYNLDRQLQLANRMGESSRHVGLHSFDGLGPMVDRWWTAVVESGKRYGVALLGLAFIALVAKQFGRDGLRWWNTRQRVLKVQRGEAEASDATLLYQRMLQVLHRRGIEKPAWLTPFEFARVLQEPEVAALVEDLTQAYNELRFGGNAEAAGRIVVLLDRLEATA